MKPYTYVIVLIAACTTIFYGVGCSESEGPTPPAEKEPKPPIYLVDTTTKSSLTRLMTDSAGGRRFVVKLPYLHKGSARIAFGYKFIDGHKYYGGPLAIFEPILDTIKIGFTDGEPPADFENIAIWRIHIDGTDSQRLEILARKLDGPTSVLYRDTVCYTVQCIQDSIVVDGQMKSAEDVYWPDFSIKGTVYELYCSSYE